MHRRKRPDPRLHWKGGFAYAVFYDPDLRARRRLWYSSGITDRRAAQEWFTDVVRAWRRDELDPWTEKHHREQRVSDVVAAYFRAHPHLKSSTVTTRQSCLLRFTRSLPAGVTLSLVGPEHVTAFLKAPSVRTGREVGLETRHGYLSALKYFFAWCLRQGLLRSDPTADVRLPKLGRRVPEFLTPREFHRLLAAVDALYEAGCARPQARYRTREGDLVWVKAPMQFAVATGLRISDVVRLEWSQVRREAGVIIVDDRTKTGNEYVVPIFELAARVLDGQAEERGGHRDELVFHSPRGGRLSKGNLQTLTRRTRKEARLPATISFHSLRHTFATWMLMQTGNIRLVSALLGHTSLEQTQGYAHVALLAMRAMQPEEFLEVGVSWRKWIESGGEAAPLSVLGTAGLAHEWPSAW